MIQLYLFTGALLMILAIVWRRHWIIGHLRKMAFKRQVASKVDELRQESQNPEKRFRESVIAEQKGKRFEVARYKAFMRKADLAAAREAWMEAGTFLIQALALAQKPDYERLTLLQLARVYLKSGDLRRAENCYTRLAEADPCNPEVLEALGKIYTQKKRFKEAIAAYVKVVEMDEKNDSALLHLGKSYRLLMRPGLAAECFRRVAELKPREVECLFLLAEACVSDEDFDNAVFTYEKILALEPYNEKAKEAIQNVRLKMKEAEIIFSNLKMVPKNNPVNPTGVLQ